MKYSFDSRIRFSEIGEDGRLTPYHLVNYFQDCSNFHGEAVGLGLDWYRNHKKGWVLTDWQIHIADWPKMGEEVKISTWGISFRGFIAERHFAMQRPDGNYVAKAITHWVFMDLEKGTPIRITKDQEAYGLHPELKLEEEFEGRKIPVAEGGVAGTPVLVQEFHIDTNHHMNNGQYVQIGQALLPKGFTTKKLRVEYKKQAFPGDTLFPRVVPVEQGYFISLENEAGEPYCLLEFSGQPQ